MQTPSGNGVVNGKRILNVNQWLNGSNVQAFHWLVIIFCSAIMAFDGYDLFIYAGAIPLVMKEFHINPAQAGMIASYMLMGATLGALFLAPLADRIGRKTALLCFMSLFSVGMLLTALTHSPGVFGICRFVTGLGVGGSLPNVAALATEYAPGKKRAVMVVIAMIGIQIGMIVAALLSIWLFPIYGWRSVFFIGALPILAVPLYAKLLPESPVRLIRRNRLDQLRTYLRKARPELEVPSDAVLELDRAAGKAPIAAIFQEHRAFSTILFWIIWFMNVYVIFGFTIWLPKLIMNHGFSLTTGLSFLLVNAIAAVVGALVAGAIADRVGSKPTLVAFYVLSFASVLLVGFSKDFISLMILVSVAGAGSQGAQNLMNCYMPAYYPPSMRSTASGVCYGVSRLGAILGPALIGVLMTLQFSYKSTLFWLAFPGLLCIAGVMAIQEKYNFTRKLVEEQQEVQPGKAAPQAV